MGADFRVGARGADLHAANVRVCYASPSRSFLPLSVNTQTAPGFPPGRKFHFKGRILKTNIDFKTRVYSLQNGTLAQLVSAPDS